MHRRALAAFVTFAVLAVRVALAGPSAASGRFVMAEPAPGSRASVESQFVIPSFDDVDDLIGGSLLLDGRWQAFPSFAFEAGWNFSWAAINDATDGIMLGNPSVGVAWNPSPAGTDAFSVAFRLYFPVADPDDLAEIMALAAGMIPRYYDPGAHCPKAWTLRPSVRYRAVFSSVTLAVEGGLDVVVPTGDTRTIDSLVDLFAALNVSAGPGSFVRPFGELFLLEQLRIDGRTVTSGDYTYSTSPHKIMALAASGGLRFGGEGSAWDLYLALPLLDDDYNDGYDLAFGVRAGF